MITATWCENRPLIVGIPRRSGEWSTESSWTSVARWMSSTIAARVTARGSAAPAPVACALSNSSVGRNSFPFMRRRCSLTSAMIGKSAAMSRRSSSTTRSSCPATGRWMSGRVTRASCWVTSARLGERLDPLAHVHEPDVRGEHAAVELSRLRNLHPGVAVRLLDLLLEDHRAEIHEVPAHGRLVADFHLGVLGLHQLALLGHRLGRHQHRERRLGPPVFRIMLDHALVHRPRLVPQVGAQQRVGELEVAIDQPRLVAGLERELDLLLAVTHAVGLEPQDLVHE